MFAAPVQFQTLAVNARPAKAAWPQMAPPLYRTMHHFVRLVFALHTHIKMSREDHKGDNTRIVFSPTKNEFSECKNFIASRIAERKIKASECTASGQISDSACKKKTRTVSGSDQIRSQQPHSTAGPIKINNSQCHKFYQVLIWK